MTRTIHIDNMDIEVWWNDREDDEVIPVCVTLYKDKRYMDYKTLRMTTEEELEFGIAPEIREGFTEWFTPSYFLTTQHLSPRIREWVANSIKEFINE